MTSKKNPNIPTRYNDVVEMYIPRQSVMPFSEFAIMTDILRKRISNEKEEYSFNEKVLARDLLQLAETFSLLFISQDTPLFNSQQDLIVNEVAKELIIKNWKPLELSEIPAERQAFFKEYNDELENTENLRNEYLNQFIACEKFLHLTDHALKFDLSCLFGLSGQIRYYIEILSSFNQIIAERCNLMLANKTTDNTYHVTDVLNYLTHFKNFHKTHFPVAYKKRANNYELLLNVS